GKRGGGGGDWGEECGRGGQGEAPAEPPTRPVRRSRARRCKPLPWYMRPADPPLASTFVVILLASGDGHVSWLYCGNPVFSLKPSAAMTEVTRILSAIEQGDPHAVEELL